MSAAKGALNATKNTVIHYIIFISIASLINGYKTLIFEVVYVSRTLTRLFGTLECLDLGVDCFKSLYRAKYQTVSKTKLQLRKY